MTNAADDLQPLLEFLKQSRGVDFSGYKRASLERRMGKRMQAVGVTGCGEYLDYLQVHPDEYRELFDTILINVTRFFRDPPAWRHLDREVLPRLVADRGDDEIRVWSAGCSSGEEACSIAMLLVRHLGEAAFRDRIKVYATDVDEPALAIARAAEYPARALEPVPGDLRERCFTAVGARYAFRKDLRRSLVFGRNDLVQDAPISHVDLVLCRNVLMYFTAETQARILRRFAFALTERGCLFLGRSEMPLTHGEPFRALSTRHRLFSKLPRAAAVIGGGSAAHPAGDDPPPARIRDSALDRSPVAQIVVDRAGTLVLANHRARSTFGLVPADLGRPFRELRVSYRPAELRSAIDRALAERRPVGVGPVDWALGGRRRRLDVLVTPLADESGEPLGASITFDDVTRAAEAIDELECARRDLVVAYEELQSTVEELETTNEELHTANEELQSTYEDLETMNEELQSTNAELEAMNDQLRDRSLELDDAGALLEAILGSLSVGVAVVDRGETVRMWSRRAEDLWGMRADEAVGRPFLRLDIGVPLERIGRPLHDALAGRGTNGAVVLRATNRRGRAIRCAFTCAPLTAGGDGVRGAIVLMEERPG